MHYHIIVHITVKKIIYKEADLLVKKYALTILQCIHIHEFFLIVPHFMNIIVIHCDYDIFGNIMYSDAMYIHNENNSSNLHKSNFVP